MMSPLRLPLREQIEARPVPDAVDFPDLSRDVLNRIRVIALQCRAKPRTDLFEACALLSVERARSAEAHAEALVRTLRQILGKSPRFFRPGEISLSFDEAWLARLITAFADGDDDSAEFLIRSRVAAQDARFLRFLLSSIVRAER